MQHQLTRALATSLAVLAFGCGESDPAAPADETPSEEEPASAASVTGNFSTQSGAGRRVVALTATRNEDGDVEGSYRISFTATGAWFEVAVTCLATSDNVAWIGGRVSASTGSEVTVGAASYFFAIDNSPADEAPSNDIASAAIVNDVAGAEATFCETRPLSLPVFTGLLGDLEIRREF